MFGRTLSRALAVAVTGSLLMATAALGADLDTSASLSTNTAARTVVEEGNNSFTIKAWLLGNVNNSNFTGVANIVNEYTMAATSPFAITASADTADRTTVTFDRSNVATEPTTARNWTPGQGYCPADTLANAGTGPVGRKTNPFSVTANLVVPAGVPDGTTATLTIASFGSNQLAADASPAFGYVEVEVEANTAPSVSVQGPANGATYEFGTVPTASCSVTDAEDTGEAATPVVDPIDGPLAAYGLGSQTVTCSYTDEGGLSDSDSVTYTIEDTGAPTITDAGPTAGPTGSNDWYVVPVTNTFTATDLGGAGFLSPLTNPHNFTQSSGTAEEGSAVKINSGTVTDVAGNVALAIDSAEFKIDLSNPYNVAFVGGPAAGSSHLFGSVPAAPTCTADDDISGVASCAVTGYSSAVGNHIMTAKATDYAGRFTEVTRSYTVLAWTLSGFYSPVDMGGTLNVVKAGSTVPLKFEIFAGATELTTIDKIASFKVGKVPCGALDTTLTDDIEQYSTGQTVLRYDSTGGQFIQNWQIPKASASAPAGSCYTATMTTLDGSFLTAYFKTK